MKNTEPVAAPRQDLRRSEREGVQIQVILRGTDAAGRQFFDRSEVVSMDRRGARMRTRFSIPPGSIVESQFVNEDISKRMRVVWQGERGSLYEGMIGLEFVNPNDTWNL